MRQASAKFEAMKAVLEKCKTCMIISHNNPDPDAIASAVLLKHLFSRKFKIISELVYGGVVGRAENKALIEYTKEDFKKFTKAGFAKVDFAAFVDAQPGAGNNPIETADKILVVFDHHKIRAETRKVPFFEVHSDVGATVTLVYQYLRAAKVRINSHLATIIGYALRSETSELQKETSLMDIGVFDEIYHLIDQRAVWKIRNAKVDIGYLACIHLGMEKAVLYGDVVIVRLDDLPYPDVIAEVAEYFLKYRPMAYAMAIGRYKDELLFSVRSDARGASLGSLVQSVTHEVGTSGGHGRAAGGQVQLQGENELSRKRIEEVIVKRFLRELKADKRKGVKLVDEI